MNLHGTPAYIGYESNLLCLLEGSFCHCRQSPVKTLGARAPTSAAEGGLAPQSPSPAPRASLFWCLLWGGFGGFGKVSSEHPVVVVGERWVLQSIATNSVRLGGFKGVCPWRGTLL